MLLTATECQRIHAAALTVLSEVGVRVDDPEIVRRLEEAGSTLDSTNRVRIPAALVEWALRQAPHEVRIADRQGHLWQLGPDGERWF